MKMKRLFVLLGSVLLVSALAVPLLAHGPGFTRGPHMMGPWGPDSGYCVQYERGYGNLTEEQRSKLQELDRKFYNETATLRNEIMAMSDELNSLLRSANPDPEKAKTLQKSISELRAKMDEKRLAYTLETRTIIPELRSRQRYGSGYRHHKRGYGSGMYGAGSCWR
jgi:Spy/CpxP family protein refolding chaperone